jgi:hypothetical protein
MGDAAMANLPAAALDKLNDSDIAMPYLAQAIDVSSVLADLAQASMVAFQITRTMARAMLEFLESGDARTIRDEPTMLERDERAERGEIIDYNDGVTPVDEAQRRDWLALRFAYLWLNQRDKVRPT